MASRGPRIRTRLQNLLPNFKRLLRGENDMSETVTEWKALVVDEVDEKALMTGAKGGSRTYPALPVAMVKLPADDCAVLSWRWDGDYQVYGSKNVLSALRCAKQIGVRYLCIDAISIDQQLQGDALLNEIVAFSTLYKTIQVIAAYDTEGGMPELFTHPEFSGIPEFIYTLLRPWISSEMRLFTENPIRISYAGHNDQGGAVLNTFDPPTTIFHRGVLHAKLTNFEVTIFGVLCGKVGMCSISDFGVIIPSYAKVLGVAYKCMSRHDYLLTAAILSFFPRPLNDNYDGWLDFNYLDIVTFDRYTHCAPHETRSNENNENDVLLDTKKLATLEVSRDGSMSRLTTLPDAARIIFAALGLSEAEYEEFAVKEETRSANLLANKDIPLPEVEVFSISLEPFR